MDPYKRLYGRIMLTIGTVLGGGLAAIFGAVALLTLTVIVLTLTVIAYRKT